MFHHYSNDSVDHGLRTSVWEVCLEKSATDYRIRSTYLDGLATIIRLIDQCRHLFQIDVVADRTRVAARLRAMADVDVVFTVVSDIRRTCEYWAPSTRKPTAILCLPLQRNVA